MAKPPKIISEEEATAFAAAYLETGGNGGQAMKRINPDLTPASARTRACLLLKNPEVKAAVSRLRQQFISTNILNLEQSLEILSNIARGIPAGGFPPSGAERIAAIKQIGIYKGWENKEDRPKQSVELGTLIARIRQARGTILEAEILPPPALAPPRADDGDAGE
jgi:hypothetical protein